MLVAAVFAWRLADRRRRRDLERFAAAGLVDELTLSLSRRGRLAKRLLVLAATFSCFAALAAPEAGFDWEETQRRGIDVLLAVDVSRSMLARDVQPDRLQRTKLAVDDLVRRLGSDRLGLIGFAGTAFLQCPLTLDHAAFRRALDALGPNTIPAPGSNLASALDVARAALATEARNIKLLILFSDGEDLRGGAIAAAERAKDEGIRVFTVGVGTPAGELIPLTDDDETGGFVKDPSGRIVKSRLDEDTLKRVAKIADGFYVPLGPRAGGIDELVERALAPLPREELASRLRRIPRNRYRWPLTLAIALLLLEPFVGERLRRASPRARTMRNPGARLALALCLGGAADARAASPESAAGLYERRDFEAASEEYRALAEEADDPRLDLNLGAASYRAERFDEAAGAFARALRSEDETLRQRAFYDLGNAQYRMGERTREAQPQETITAWKQALAAYDEALALDESDGDARFNRDLVQRKLDELQRQQEQQDSEDDDPQSDSDDEQDGDPQDQDGEPEPQDGDPRDQDNQPQDGDPRDQDNQPQDGDPRDQDNQPQDGDPRDQDGDPEPQDGGNQEQDGDNQDRDEEPADREGEPETGDEDPADEPKDGNGSAADGSEDADGAPNDAPGPAGDAQRPAQLTPAEARDLLDSLRGDEEFMPMVPGEAAGSDDPRDW